MLFTQEFEKSVELVRKLKSSPTNDELLQLYGLYKQSTIGNCNTSEPSKIFNYRESLKWHAWNKLKNKSKDECMEKYINLVIDLAEKYGCKK